MMNKAPGHGQRLLDDPHKTKPQMKQMDGLKTQAKGGKADGVAYYIKYHIVKENLKKRKQQHRKHLVAYQEKLEVWNQVQACMQLEAS